MTTADLANERRIAKYRRHESPSAANHHNYLCRQVRKSAKEDKEAHIDQVCAGI